MLYIHDLNEGYQKYKKTCAFSEPLIAQNSPLLSLTSTISFIHHIIGYIMCENLFDWYRIFHIISEVLFKFSDQNIHGLHATITRWTARTETICWNPKAEKGVPRSFISLYFTAERLGTLIATTPPSFRRARHLATPDSFYGHLKLLILDGGFFRHALQLHEG